MKTDESAENEEQDVKNEDEDNETEEEDENSPDESFEIPTVKFREKAITYTLWLTLGWFGTHHFYLKRDRHAFVWFWTLGGGCGLGWLCEVINLNSYLLQSKYEESYIKGTLPYKVPEFPRKPPTRIKRIAGEVGFSYLMGLFGISLIPAEIMDDYPIAPVLVTTVCVAIGVHTVANIGYQRCTLVSCLGGALIPTLAFFSPYPLDTSALFFYSCLSSTLCANWKGVSWCKTRPKHHNICKRMIVLGFANLMMGCLVLGAIYQTGSFRNSHGETVRVKDSIENMLNSPAWADFKKTVVLLWDKFWEGGLTSFRRAMLIALDPDGEEAAYTVLGVPSSAKEDEIRQSYRTLVKQYHPDKVAAKSEKERKEAQDRFVEIQQAYERLSYIKERRARKNEL